MPLYAVFDHTQAAPQLVTGWIDTDAVSYPNLPADADLLQVTAEQWAAHFTTANFAVNNGTIEPFVLPPPVLTLAQQAAAAMYAGLTVTLSGGLSLAATPFAVDPDAQRKLTAVCTTANTTGGFPGGVTTFPMRDMAGNWHYFAWPVYKVVAAALASYAAAIDLIVDGNPLNATSLPSNTVALSV